MHHIRLGPFVYAFVLLAACPPVFAQSNYAIELYGLRRGSLAPDDFWTLNLTNPAPDTRTVSIYASVVEETEGEVVQVTSFPFEMATGISQVSAPFVGTHEIVYLRSNYRQAIENFGQFPPGNYTICVKLMLFGNVVATHCSNHKVTQALPVAPAAQPAGRQQGQGTHPSPMAEAEANGGRQGFSTSGELDVYGFYSDDAAIAPAYLQTEFSPVFTFGSVPFKGNALFITNDLAHENSILGNHRRISGGSLRYDYLGYRNNMVKRLRQRMANDSNRAARPRDSEKDELARLQAFLNDPEVVRERKMLETLDKGDLNYNLSVARRSMGELQGKKRLYDSLELRANTLLRKVGAGSAKIKSATMDWGDNAVLKGKLKQYGLYKGVHKWWFNLRELGLGDVYPALSPLTLYGTRLTGVHFAINPGAFYLELAGGHTRGGILSGANQQLQSQEFRRLLGVVRMGLGQPERSHLYATFMPSRDDSGSLEPGDADSLGITPQLNLVMGLEGQLSLWQNKLRLFGEFNASKHTADTELPDLVSDNAITDEMPPWGNILPRNSTTTADYAYLAGVDIRPTTNTEIGFETRKVGAGYRSFGLPFLQNDLTRYEIRANHYLLKRRLRVGGFYRHDADGNIDSLKTVQTKLQTIGANMQLRFDKAPDWQFDIRHAIQQNDSTFNITSMRLGATHSFATGKLAHRMDAGYQMQRSSNTKNYKLNGFSFGDRIGFAIPLAVAVRVGLNLRNENDTGNKETTLLFDGNAGYELFGMLNLKAGVQYYNNELSGRITPYGEALLRFWRQRCSLGLRAEYNKYKSASATEGYGFAGRTNLRVRW